METFSALLAICAGNSPVTGEFPAQRPVTRSFDVIFNLRLNKRWSKQSWFWWFETPSRPLWRHCNDNVNRRVRTSSCYGQQLRSFVTQLHAARITSSHEFHPLHGVTHPSHYHPGGLDKPHFKIGYGWSVSCIISVNSMSNIIYGWHSASP